jgi:hypothetical protein
MPEPLDLDTLAASLRTSGDDLSSLLEVLAYKLELTLPRRVRVHRRTASFLSKQKRVQWFELSLGDATYRMERVADGRIVATKALVVRGIALSRDEQDVDTWLRALVTDLAVLADTSAADRAALERELLGIDPSPEDRRTP